MDFIDQLKQFSTRVSQVKDVLTTEEATKNSLILPFFQMMGYDVFNPLEFVPEFTADVGIKKGEKVDYAIMLDGKPAILIEAKWCGASLEKHDSQLFRYFGTTPAKFGILTNGIIYKFFTDLDESNKMDLTPFLEFNLLELQDSLAPELKRFTKSVLNIEEAFSAASELKYTNLIKNLLRKQRSNPDDSFINYVLGEIYPGRRTQQVVERFTSIIKRALNSYLNDVINETLKNAMQQQDETVSEKDSEQPLIADEEPEIKVVTTSEELEALGVIKGIIRSALDTKRITYKDTESYFSIICDNNIRKWICRIRFANNSYLFLPEDKYRIECIDDIYLYADQIVTSAKRFA